MSSAFVSSTPLLQRNGAFRSSPLCPQAASSRFNGRGVCPPPTRRSLRSRMIWLMKVGIYFATTTGTTQSAADVIKDTLGDEADEPIDIGNFDADKMLSYDMLFVGTPTWNTGADTERSGTVWDDFLYDQLENLNFDGKPVAVFGLGDAQGYPEYFCDAMEEVHTCFQKQGAKMIGYTPSDAFGDVESKSIFGEQYCGLPIDEVSGEYDLEDRVGFWCKEVMKEAGLAVAA